MNRQSSMRSKLGGWMALLVLSLLPVVGHPSAALPECPTEEVGVLYEVAISRAGSHRTEEHALYQKGGSLLQVQMREGVADLWERTRNGGVHLVRYFDADQRAIEYQPDDLGFRSDAPFLQRMALLNALCGSTEVVHEAPVANGDMGDTVVTVWRRLEVITEAQLVSSAFDDRASYLSTDYADIGDNESDPFLRRMINLGFVEHGSSGIYDAEGHAMGAEHAH